MSEFVGGHVQGSRGMVMWYGCVMLLCVVGVVAVVVAVGVGVAVLWSVGASVNGRREGMVMMESWGVWQGWQMV